MSVQPSVLRECESVVSERRTRGTVYDVRRSVLIWGERDDRVYDPVSGDWITMESHPHLVVRGVYPVVIYRVHHTEGHRTKFERQLDRRGVEWVRIPTNTESLYEVWGPVDCLRRLSRESMVTDVTMGMDR